MGFLTDKFKGKYRLMAPYDLSTNDFPRKLNGTLEDIDVYIDCKNNIKIFYFGKGKLEVYVPTINRGRKIIRNIYSDFIKPIEETNYYTSSQKTDKNGEVSTLILYDYDLLYRDLELNKLIFDIYETDEEVVFKFHWDKMEQFEKYFQPKISCADRSPFSTKNLPKTKYNIPAEDLEAYKNITSKIPENLILSIAHTTNLYLKSLVNKKLSWEEIKADMRKKGLRTKDYIHSIGKWDEYLKYLEKNL